MRTLIAKLGATGDVVRTTTLLHLLRGEVTWVTTKLNQPLLSDLKPGLRTLCWEERELLAGTEFDLVINLEDTLDVALFLKSIKTKARFGAYSEKDNVLHYTPDSRGWFDLSLISVHGREAADRLKLANRRTYQDLVLEGLGFKFQGEPYLLPKNAPSGLRGDIALATETGPVWPMKQWAYYDLLKAQLEERGYKVNVLPRRPTLLEHLGDVRGHRCLVSGDTLPMHLALGSGVSCVTIFNCTSPWEIFEYGIQTKLVSPLLGEFFYKRGLDPRATTAIELAEVLEAVDTRMA